MVLSEILKVIYAPHKAFKEILEKPKYLGAFILLIIFVIAQIGSSYMVGSRQFYEQTLPAGKNGNEWTQNSALWQANSGVIITNNTADYISSSGDFYASSIPYLGSSTVEFTASNATLLSAQLNNLDGSVNCGADGFKNISLRVKIITPNAAPESAILYLYSLSTSNYFSFDLTSMFPSSTVNVWNNLTVPVGSGGWSSAGAASWENITSLKLEFKWTSEANIDLRLDGLFFRGIYKSPIEINGLTSYLLQSVLSGVSPFIFEWILLTALMYIIIKGLKGTVTWRPLMVAVGLALVVLVIQAVILVGALTTLPKLYYPLEFLAGIPGELEIAYNVILNQIGTINMVTAILQIAVYVWIAALGGFIVREVTASPPAATPSPTPTAAPFSWMKSLLVSGASLLLTILIMYYILGV